MEKNHTALFIGHSECYGLSRKAVEDAIVDLVNRGVTAFLSGGQGGFDRMCAGCVHALRKEYPQIRNYLVIPYLNFTVFDKSVFDEILYPEGFEQYHFKAAIPARNNFMIENAAYAICYVNHGWGGAAKTYEKAVKSNLCIINLGDTCD